jgi:hypothetical protein
MRVSRNGFAVVFVALLFVPSFVFALVSIQWSFDENVQQGVMRYDGVTPLPGNSIVQLIWSPDAVLGPLNVNDPLTPSGNDVLLDADGSTWSAMGGYWVFSARDYDGGGTYVGGYAFQRVFDVTVGNTPGEGDYYGDGTYVCGPLEDADIPAPPPPDSSYLFSSSGSPFVVGTVIVPEPGTLILVLIGFLGVVGRNNQTHENH